MKRTIYPCLAAALLPMAVVAQPFEIGWHRIAGGGGASAGGAYSLVSTIGQADASSRLAGGTYAVTGGLLTLPVAVQNPGAPQLAITALPQGQIVISWFPATPGYILQQSSSLHPPAWVNAPSAGQNPVTLSAGAASRFYSLTKP